MPGSPPQHFRFLITRTGCNPYILRPSSKSAPGKILCSRILLSAWGVILRPISLLRLSLLRFVDSHFLGNSLRTGETPPLKIKILLESNPPRSRILVRRLAALIAQQHTQRAQNAEAQEQICSKGVSNYMRNVFGWLRLGWLKIP